MEDLKSGRLFFLKFSGNSKHQSYKKKYLKIENTRKWKNPNL